MSLSGLSNTQFPLTLDGTTSLDVSSLTIDGVPIDITALVPYVGASSTLDMGAQNIKTTHNPTVGSDVINLTTLTAAVLYGDTANALTYLNKITTGDQTVAGTVTYNASQTYGDKNTLLDGMKLDGGIPSTGSWEIDVTAGPTLGENPLQFKHFQTDKKVVFRSDGKIYSEALITNKALICDASGNIVSSGVDSIKITYLDNVSSDIQTSLNEKAVLVGGNSFSGSQNYSDKTASTVAIFDGSKNLTSSAVSVTELNYIGGVTSGVQGQLNGKLSLTGGSLSGALSMGANKISSSSVPSVGDDLTNKTYVDGAVSGAGSLYVLKTGSTMTGALIVDAGVSVGTRLLGTPDGSPGNFWMGLRGSGTEVERLAISIAGPVATGVVSGVTISKPLYLTATGIVANRVPYVDGDKILKTSIVTSTELGNLSGSTSSIQSQLDAIFSTLPNFLPKAGGTLTGTVYNTGGNFHPYKGGDMNKGVYLFANNADGATYASYNGGLGSWNGIGFFCSSDSTTRFIFNTRDGTSSQTGRLTCAGVSSTSTVEVGLASNTTASIKLANSLNHITGNASETFLFNGVNGYMAIGRNTTRSVTEANLMMGTVGTDCSIESIASNGSAYLPLKFYASSYTFVTGGVTVPSLTTTGTVTAGSVNTNKYARYADYRGGMSPSQQPVDGMGFYFGTFNNNNTGNYADLLCLNSWGDGSAGSVNLLAFNKGAKGIRQYQGTSGSGSAFSTYYDCVMTDANSGNVSISGNVSASNVSASGSLTFGTGGTYTAGCIYADSGWGCVIRAKTAGTGGRFLWSDVNDVYQMRISPSGVLNFHGGATISAVNIATTPGALVIGGTNQNYNDGWNTGLMMECSDTTGITIHDTGVKLASFMYYSGNRFYMGKDAGSGWSTTPIQIDSSLYVQSNLYLNSPPIQSVVGVADSGLVLGWDYSNTRVTRNQIEAYHSGPANNYQQVNWNGLNRTSQFYKESYYSGLLITGYATSYVTSAGWQDIQIRLYNQSTGAYYYFASYQFYNVTYNHAPTIININAGALPTGWYDVYTYIAGGGQGIDNNDVISITYTILPNTITSG